MKGIMDIFVFDDFYVIAALKGMEARKYMADYTGNSDYLHFDKKEMRRLKKKELPYFWIIDEETYLGGKKCVQDIIDNHVYMESVLLAEGNFIED